jgi:hypothetical protein
VDLYFLTATLLQNLGSEKTVDENTGGGQTCVPYCSEAGSGQQLKLKMPGWEEKQPGRYGRCKREIPLPDGVSG